MNAAESLVPHHEPDRLDDLLQRGRRMNAAESMTELTLITDAIYASTRPPHERGGKPEALREELRRRLASTRPPHERGGKPRTFKFVLAYDLLQRGRRMNAAESLAALVPPGTNVCASTRPPHERGGKLYGS